jgi:hypothetical protein
MHLIRHDAQASNTARVQSLRLEASSYRPFEQPTAEAIGAIAQVISIVFFYNYGY